MSNTIKKSLFALLLLAISHMNSAVKAMNYEDEHNTLAYGISGVRGAQNDELSLVTQSTSLQTLNLDEPQTSWGSSIISYGYSIGKLAQDIASNPYKGIIVGTYVLLNFATPAAACYCTCAGSPSKEGCRVFQMSGIDQCRVWCNEEGFVKSTCEN